jgi:hypothetical protein
MMTGDYTTNTAAATITTATKSTMHLNNSIFYKHDMIWSTVIIFMNMVKEYYLNHL